MEVMLWEYGTDDMDHLIDTSPVPGRVAILARGKQYNLKVTRFDNRDDLTTFVRDPRETWKEEDIKAIHEELKVTMARLASE